MTDGPDTCTNCGSPVEADAKFCSRCGLGLTVEAAAAAPVSAPATTAEVQQMMVRLSAALGDRYQVQRELGRGGMATVFLARDIKHDREVAIKVLHPDLSASIGAERFEREIRLAAKLQHPHILGLYDSGSAEGLLFYVMPFVKGESLRDRLDREGMLPIEDAIKITLEVCSALGHAHAAGVVHRDIKPENVLLSGDHSLVADFGIARAASDSSQAKLTQTGMSVGTPAYMAPEQSTGDAIGPTADIYSLGCMLYEMLAGEAPFTGPNAMAIMARHLMEQPPSVRIVRSTVPEALEEAIYVALNKAPVDRPQTAAQFAEMVGLPIGATSTMMIMHGGARRTAATARVTTASTAIVPPPVPWWKQPALRAAAGLTVVLAAAALYWSQQGTAAPAVLGEEARRLAVLYFDDRSADSSLAPVAAGLTEGLIRSLQTTPSLTVVSRSGVEPFRDADVPLDSIARQLRVGYLVRGNLEPERDRVRVSVRLDLPSGVVLQSGSFAVARDSLLLLQDSLAGLASELIRRQLGTELRVRSQQVATQSTEAWILLQRGVQAQRSAEAARAAGNAEAADRGFLAADSIYALAETLDPAWAEPAAYRAALAYRRSRLQGREPIPIREWVTVGLEHADRALARDPNHADALETRGTLRYWGYLANIENDPDRKEMLRQQALTDLERSTAVNRAQAGAYATLASLYANLPGKTINDVYLAAQRAYEADEFLSNANIILGRLFFAAYDLGNTSSADGYCGRLQQRFPSDPRAIRCRLYLMTMPNAGTPDVTLAWRLADSAVALTPAPDRPLARFTHDILVAGVIARAAASQPALADSVRNVVLRSQGDGTIDQPRELAMYGAFVLTVLGDHDDAMRMLSTYLAANPQSAQGLRNDPGWWFRPLASRDDFRRLVGAGL